MKVGDSSMERGWDRTNHHWMSNRTINSLYDIKKFSIAFIECAHEHCAHTIKDPSSISLLSATFVAADKLCPDQDRHNVAIESDRNRLTLCKWF